MIFIFFRSTCPMSNVADRSAKHQNYIHFVEIKFSVQKKTRKKQLRLIKRKPVFEERRWRIKFVRKKSK